MKSINKRRIVIGVIIIMLLNMFCFMTVQGVYAQQVNEENTNTGINSQFVDKLLRLQSNGTTKMPLDIILVMDLSGSMEENNKINQLKEVVNFIVDKSAEANEQVNKEEQYSRIAAIKFAGDKTDRIGDEHYGSNQVNYTQIVKGYEAYKDENTEKFQSEINALKPSGATSADYAMDHVADLVNKSKEDEINSERKGVKRIVIFFTDGQPTHSSGFEKNVANEAISKAHALKADAEIYTIGIFKGANASITGHVGEGDWTDEELFNSYMHGLSSNYLDAFKYDDLGIRANGEDGKETQYYKAVENAAELGKLFGSDLLSECTEDQLFGEYASYLNNQSYKNMCGEIRTEVDDILWSRSKMDNGLSALKSCLKAGAWSNLRSIISGFSGKFFEEKKLEEALALELVQDVAEDENVSQDIMNDVKRAHKIDENINKGVGYAMKYGFKNADRKVKVAEQLSGGLFTKNDILVLIESAEEHEDQWNRDLKSLGIAVDSANMAINIALTMEANHEIVTQLMESVDKDTPLYRGLSRIDKKLKHTAVENVIPELLDYGIDKCGGFLVDAASGAFAPVEFGFMIVGAMIPLSGIEDINKTVIAASNTTQLSIIRDDLISKIILNHRNGGSLKTEDLKLEYKLIYSAYLSSLDSSVAYASKIATDKQKQKLKKDYDRIKKSLTYENYIKSCLANANADWSYEVRNGKAAVKGYTTRQKNSSKKSASLKAGKEDSSEIGYSMDIPEKIDGYDVGYVNEEAFKADTTLKCITIPDPVAELGSGAFASCSNLDSVYMGSGLKNIGNKAFEDCSALSNVKLPYAVENIGADTFAGTTNLVIEAQKGSAGETYAEKNSNVTFENVESRAVSISIENKPEKLSYGMSEDIDPVGMTVKAGYEDGTEKDVTKYCSSTFIDKKPGTVSVEVRFDELTETYDVEVTADPCEYRVRYENECGDEIADQMTGRATAGEKVTLTAPEIKGYTVDEQEMTRVIGADDEFVITYTSKPKKSLKNAEISYQRECQYTGKQIKPDVKIIYDKKILKEGEDYYLDYDTNKEAGKGGVLVCGIGEYVDELWLEFDIIYSTWFEGCNYSIFEYEENSLSATLIKTDDSDVKWTGQVPAEITIEYPVESGVVKKIPVEVIDGAALADTDKTVITIPASVVNVVNTDEVQNGTNKIKEFRVDTDNESFTAEEGVLYRIINDEVVDYSTKWLWLYPNKKKDAQFDIPEDVDTINELFNNPNLKKIGIGKKLELDEFNPFLQYGTDWNDDGEPIAYSIQLIIDGQNTDAIQWAKDHNLKYSVKGDSTTRLSGSSRYETAITAADQLKDVMGIEKFENIIVADGGNYPDALTGSYLAKVKNAPILLVTGSKSQMISDYIDKNLKKGGKVYILGGEGAVSASFEKALKSNRISVKRLAGKTRYETNLEILKQAGVKDGELLICSGNGFADSLSASAAGKPILLVNEDITKEQQNYIMGLSIDRFYIIGGAGAVNAKTEKSVKRFGSVKRLSGSTRYETSAAVAETFFGSECENAVLAYGQNFPDGLAGGPLAMALHGPLLLAENSAYDSVAAFVQKAGVKSLYVLGGESLISDRVVAKIIKSK